MRNSLLTKEFCAEDLRGSSSVPKIRTPINLLMRVVGERPYCSEVYGVSRNGAIGSENVGMSNHNRREIRRHLKPKVSLAIAIIQGLGGPKLNPKGVSDGQPVNIPARPSDKIRKTQSKFLEGLLDFRLRVSASFKN